MSGHSPEPWLVNKSGDVEAADGRQIVWAHPNDDAWHRCDASCAAAMPVEQADMERIVACVNACRGLPTEMLNRVAYRHIGDPYYATLRDVSLTLEFGLGPSAEQLRTMAILLMENGYEVRNQAG